MSIFVATRYTLYLLRAEGDRIFEGLGRCELIMIASRLKYGNTQQRLFLMGYICRNLMNARRNVQIGLLDADDVREFPTLLRRKMLVAHCTQVGAGAIFALLGLLHVARSLFHLTG